MQISYTERRTDVSILKKLSHHKAINQDKPIILTIFWTHLKENEWAGNLLWRERLMVNDHEEGLQRAGWIKPKKSLITVCKKLLLQLRVEKYDPSNRNMMSPCSPESKKDKRDCNMIRQTIINTKKVKIKQHIFNTFINQCKQHNKLVTKKDVFDFFLLFIFRRKILLLLP